MGSDRCQVSGQQLHFRVCWYVSTAQEIRPRASCDRHHGRFRSCKLGGGNPTPPRRDAWPVRRAALTDITSRQSPESQFCRTRKSKSCFPRCRGTRGLIHLRGILRPSHLYIMAISRIEFATPAIQRHCFWGDFQRHSSQLSFAAVNLAGTSSRRCAPPAPWLRPQVPFRLHQHRCKSVRQDRPLAGREKWSSFSCEFS